MTDHNSQSLVNKSESEKLVLASLRRNDDSIEEVLVTANHVCLYEFQLNVSQWKRRTVEGSLFIVKRSSHPRFQLIILNRLSPANHVEDMVLERADFERSGPYVLYKNTNQEVLGIWFYEEKESEKVFKFLQKISLAFGTEEGGSGGLPKEALGTIGAKAKAKKPTAKDGIDDLLGMLGSEGRDEPQQQQQQQQPSQSDSQGGGRKNRRGARGGKGGAGNGEASLGIQVTKAQLRAALQRVARREEFADLLWQELSSGAPPS